MSQSPYGNESSDQVNFYGQQVGPQPAPAPIDFSPGTTDHSYPSYADPRPSGAAYAEPIVAEPSYADPASYSYAQPGVGYSVPTTYNTVAPYTPTTGYYYQHLPEHPSATPSLIWGLLGLFVFPPLAYVALAVSGRARREMQEQPRRYSDSGQLTAGWVMGILGSVLCSFYLLVAVFVVVLALSF